MTEIARHVLLLAVLMTDNSPSTERCERFLEILMNARVRVSTAEYIERIVERLNRVACAVFAGEIGTVLDDPISQITQLHHLRRDAQNSNTLHALVRLYWMDERHILLLQKVLSSKC